MNEQTPPRVRRLCTTLLVLAGLILLPFQALAQEDVNVQVVQVDAARFPEIDVYVSATDANGQPVTTIEPGDFVLFENGLDVGDVQVTQAGEYGRVTTVLVVDKSGSMEVEGKMAAARQAAIAFVDLMRPGDYAGVIAFDTVVTTVQELTSTQAVLIDAIGSIDTGTDTALYDALHAAAGMLEPATGRKAIIAVTDGMNTAGDHTITETLELVTDLGISIYTIGLGDPTIGTEDYAGMDEATLQDIAERSLGIYTRAPTGAELTELYEGLSLRIQNEYKLTYTSPTPLRDGTPREIVVTVSDQSADTDGDAGYNPGGVIPEVEEGSTWPLFGLMLVVLVFLLVLPGLIGWIVGLVGGGKGTKKTKHVRLTDTPEAKKKQAKKKTKKRKKTKKE